MIIAIDGPAGAGKSTTAKAVARELGIAHMDTGAMYRAITLAFLRDGLAIDDPKQLDDLVAAIDVSLDDGSVHMDGVDVTGELRSTEVTEAVAAVAATPPVRAALVPLQRRLAAERDIVVEGRDIGTVVFPGAEVKIYLTASPSERAKRRTRQLGLEEAPETVDELEEEIRSRDDVDATREVSPLAQATEALLIDSTTMTLDEVVRSIVAAVEKRDR
ncbi:MAG: CMP/dCMP kinase [Actinomycetota bacterium]|jgi:cytidylate kinase|nr:CMP/dCMP kinase [Actinomycetota bacterium]